MSRFTRRDWLKTTCASGAAAILPAVDLFAAQQGFRFQPLQLNPQAMRHLNPRVTALDEHENQALDALLNPNFQGERQALQAVDRDLEGLLTDPGRPVGFEPGAFRQEITQIHDAIVPLLGGVIRQTTVLTIIQRIDIFVGHWYPVNDLYEVRNCELKIWNMLQSPSPNLRLIELYCRHIRFELQSLFQFHQSGVIGFGTQCGQLLGVIQRVEQSCRFGQIRECDQNFMRFTMATDLFCLKYYPQWCG
ncbi:hypothetical protein Isop_2497 [Isosphaera pallida ATCC 43644]|uniref:Uncharacterized protein n=1 Tax=Isosphaera pallida (strain ATCC 43644 / DSM 9630 / IS1B) TaxID=575540 RepID=E8QXM1_ISOPI|nr:hypothetical protein [Isosphaera pallida]ADV63069.1 hypothetical protein Isop_2497 [Isosphaera pallida ATCC 43644]